MLFHRYLLFGIITLATTMQCACAGQPAGTTTPASTSPTQKGTIMKLPEPQIQGKISIEETLFERRSVRGYKNEALSLAGVSQLLWAAQGITDANGGRTAPSAGALYPLEVYLVAGNVAGLPAGIYKYSPEGHSIKPIIDGDRRAELSRAALGQTFIADAPASFVITTVYARTMVKYGERGIRYADLEAGHAAENLLLQGVAIGIGTVPIGAFDDRSVAAVLELPRDETPLYIIPAGRK
jgi:SagB-type dehydrogenase family enzyme